MKNKLKQLVNYILFGITLTSCTNHFDANTNVTANGYVTVNATVPIPPVPSDWCKYIPEQYRHYIPSCQDNSLSKPTVAALYPSYPNWNDYVRVSDHTTACDGSETSYNACANGGPARLATTLETSCSGLSLTDSLGVFDWSCSVSNGVAIFTSSLKTVKGLQQLISGTSFIPMSVTLSKVSVTTTSDTSVWWSNPITTLPDNSSTGAASVTLSSSGTIYVTSSDIYTSGYNITADKVSVVALNGATIYRNAKSGTDTTLSGTVGTGYRTVLSTGGHKFLWVEGSYDMNDTNTGGEFTVFLSNTTLSRLNGVTSKRGYPVYLYQSNYNTLNNVLAMNSSDFGITLDSSNGNSVVNCSASSNANHYGLGVGNSGGNSVYNLKVDSGFGGLRVWSTTASNTFDNLLFTNVTSGAYIVTNTVENYISNMTASNVSTNSGLYFDRSDNQHASNILIDTCHMGLTLSVAHTNSVSEIKIVNCDTGIYEYDGYGLALSREVWLTDSVNCNNSYGSNPGFHTDCTAAGSSTHTLVNSSSNKFGYQL